MPPPCDVRYAQEKFDDALDYLATHDQPLRTRLVDAYRDGGIGRVGEVTGDVDPEVNAALGRIHEAFSRFDDVSGEGLAESSGHLLSETEAHELAALILDTSRRLTEAYYRAGDR